MKPILFNTEMVKAILDGRKTQTRRPITKNQIYCPSHEPITNHVESLKYNQDGLLRCAQYQPGDVLYVRETFGVVNKHCPLVKQVLHLSEYTRYRADEECRIGDGYDLLYKATQEIDPDFPIQWRPNIHMPKWAARIFLKVTGVRVEGVQDISYDDARAEGVEVFAIHEENGFKGLYPKAIPTGLKTADQRCFQWIWEQVYPGSWERNDWVFVYEFERCEKEI